MSKPAVRRATFEADVLAQLRKVAARDGFKIEADPDTKGRYRLLTTGGNFLVDGLNGADRSIAGIADLLDPHNKAPRQLIPIWKSVWGKMVAAVDRAGKGGGK